MEITQRVEDGIAVVQPNGRIDTEAAEQLDQVLQAAVASGSHKIVVDMSEVEYISSAGLRSLAAVLVRCRDEGGDMKLAGLNERVTRVFKIIGFDLLMSVSDTVETAISEFSSVPASQF
jgi:anti-sigma B factor antagonist